MTGGEPEAAQAPHEEPAPARVAYKILPAAAFEQFRAAGDYAGSDADLADGFIHLSAASQLDGTLEKHFAGHADLVIAAIDLVALGARVRWEKSRGGALFPHVYGTLPFATVIAASPLEREPDGSAKRPA